VEQKLDDMQELVTEIARALVDEPGAVVVDAVERDENTVLRLRVAPSDVGKVIGKQGRTARSMRTILGAVSMKHHHRYTLDILEEDGRKMDSDGHHDSGSAESGTPGAAHDSH
jgi:predicted RNA-binding protein YlqC (UPF0109 family)